MAGRLTTHVLDTARGVPAAGMRIDLYRLGGAGGRGLVSSHVTNGDGRVDQPLLAGDAFAPGEYELVFHAGAYQRGCGFDIGTPPFLDLVPVRFAVAQGGAHYHVPLLLSPFGYSTYRGS